MNFEMIKEGEGVEELGRGCIYLPLTTLLIFSSCSFVFLTQHNQVTVTHSPNSAANVVPLLGFAGCISLLTPAPPIRKDFRNSSWTRNQLHFLLPPNALLWGLIFTVSFPVSLSHCLHFSGVFLRFSHLWVCFY